ncbi:MAG: M20 family metallopeptidase [Desulfobacterales bacterium]|nr:M20 family metallopeptidase [Desulfobacterales bacterium]MCP4162251.1 M20 family metallopeptidase [Deltaproteobacteria bacterium]
MAFENEMVEILKDLIRFESVHSKIGEIEKCSLYIENFLEINSISFEKIVHNGYPSILVTPKAKEADVIFMSHMDVVDGSKEMFNPYIDGDRLYGRGSVDDKYAIALSLMLCKKYYRKNSGTEDLPFGILITSDEEIGGENCARKIVKELKTSFCVVLDGGNPEKIVIEEKGFLKVKLVSQGKSAHGSRPWLGENAIDKLILDYDKLKTLFIEKKEGNWNKTINLGIINAGSAHNQVPESATGIFDLRFTEEDDVEELIDEITKITDSEVTVEAIGPVFSGGQSPYLDKLLEISSSKTGTEHGASDARHISEFGIKGVVWGAEGNKTQHSKDEHVEIPSIVKLYEIFDVFIQNFMK